MNQSKDWNKIHRNVCSNGIYLWWQNGYNPWRVYVKNLSKFAQMICMLDIFAYIWQSYCRKSAWFLNLFIIWGNAIIRNQIYKSIRYAFNGSISIDPIFRHFSISRNEVYLAIHTVSISGNAPEPQENITMTHAHSFLAGIHNWMISKWHSKQA